MQWPSYCFVLDVLGACLQRNHEEHQQARQQDTICTHISMALLLYRSHVNHDTRSYVLSTDHIGGYMGRDMRFLNSDDAVHEVNCVKTPE